MANKKGINPDPNDQREISSKGGKKSAEELRAYKEYLAELDEDYDEF